MLREIRADVKRIEATMTTKDDLAKVKDELANALAKVDARNDVLLRVVKENHRVVGKRIRAREICVGARRPR